VCCSVLQYNATCRSACQCVVYIYVHVGTYIHTYTHMHIWPLECSLCTRSLYIYTHTFYTYTCTRSVARSLIHMYPRCVYSHLLSQLSIYSHQLAQHLLAQHLLVQPLLASMTDFTENAASPKSTKSRNSDPSVSRVTHSNRDFGAI